VGPEDAYGTVKCVAFASEAIAELHPRRVLDVGCGTGRMLTWPLAQAHPEARFLGIDADARSIDYARAACVAPNLEFERLAELPADRRFELIIASEVIEHVEAPAAFLRDLRKWLAPGGRVVLTVPNGYGPSELASLAETLLALTGVLGLARAVKRAFRPKREAAPVPRDTLAVSPHINFFSWGELQRTLAAAGLAPRRYRARTLFCGFGFDFAIRSERAARWNARVADRVPKRCVSGWMFVLEPNGPAAAEGEYRRGLVSRLRRRLNEKRWGLP